MIISTFSTIGFPVESESSLADLAEFAIEVGQPVSVQGGSYVAAKYESGVELWAQIDAEGHLIGLNPHYSGKTTQKLQLERTVSPKDGTGFDGGFYGWINPSDLKANAGDYPLLFSVPDYLNVRDITLPSIRTVQITAFAQEVDVFENEDEFLASQTNEEDEQESLTFAARSFVPTGLFTEDSQDDPTPLALIFGYVTKSEERINEVTGEMFVSIILDTVGGHFDVVIDPRLLDALPRQGSILGGIFWLSGRLIEHSSE